MNKKLVRKIDRYWSTANRAVLTMVGILFTASMSLADIVFQADFNGAGGGTGGENDIVTVGGTGSLAVFANAGEGVVSDVSTGSPTLRSDGYWHTFIPVDFDHTVAGNSYTPARLNLVPAAETNSVNVFYSKPGDHVLLNGAMDFFVRGTALGPATSNHLILQMGKPAGGLDFVAVVGAGYMGFKTQSDANGLGAGVNNILHMGAVPGLDSNTIVHMAFTYETDPGTGETTARFFARTNGGEIDPDSTTHLIAENIFNVNEAVVTNGFSTGTITFSSNNKKVPTSPPHTDKTMDMDLFRIYNEVPALFTTIPVPPLGTVILIQ